MTQLPVMAHVISVPHEYLDDIEAWQRQFGGGGALVA